MIETKKVGSQFDIYCLHHPFFRKLDVKARKRKGRIGGPFPRLVMTFLSLWRPVPLSCGFFRRRLRGQKRPFLKASFIPVSAPRYRL